MPKIKIIFRVWIFWGIFWKYKPNITCMKNCTTLDAIGPNIFFWGGVSLENRVCQERNTFWWEPSLVHRKELRSVRSRHQVWQKFTKFLSWCWPTEKSKIINKLSLVCTAYTCFQIWQRSTMRVTPSLQSQYGNFFGGFFSVKFRGFLRINSKPAVMWFFLVKTCFSPVNPVHRGTL